jgi:hypothetical protein
VFLLVANFKTFSFFAFREFMAAPVSSGEQQQQQQSTPATDSSGAVPKPHPERIARKYL